MRSAFAFVALATLAAANPVAQGVTEAIAPADGTPAGCSDTYSASFNIQIVNVTDYDKRSLEKRKNVLTLTLADGILTDSEGRTGYIASNSQFQFDDPPQAGAIFTAGWSICQNHSLSLGSDAVFFKCLSGTFYNLYDDNVLDAEQCSKVYIHTVDSSDSEAIANQYSDGQPQASSAVAPAAQISDGQIQATSDVMPMSMPMSTTSQIMYSTGTAAPISQISDGQIQAPTNGTGVATPSVTVQAATGDAAPVRAGLFGVAAAAMGVAML